MNPPPRLRLVHSRPEDEEPPQGTPDPDEAAHEASERAARARRRAALARQAVGALCALQALMALHDLPRTAGLIATGAIAPWALAAVPASLALYGAALRLVLDRAGAGARATFLLAAGGFALSVPFWGLASPWSTPYEFGATLALAGAWVIGLGRPPARPPGDGAAV